MANNTSLAMQAPAIRDAHPSVRAGLRHYSATTHKKSNSLHHNVL
jgi:hypothetical protein